MSNTPVVVDIWLDALDASSYLALQSFRTALSEDPHRNDFVVILHPFFGNNEGVVPQPEVSSEVVDLAARMGIRFSDGPRQGSESRAMQILIAYGRELDEERGDVRGADTLSLKLASALLRSRWEIGADLSNPETLVAVAQDLQLDGARVSAALKDGLLEEAVDEGSSMGLYLGITSAPLFLFGEQLVVEGVHDPEAFARILESAWAYHQEQRG